MKVTFSLQLGDHTGLFEQIRTDTRSGNKSSMAELKLDEFSKTRRVVITSSLSITESFQNRIQFDQLSFEFTNSTRASSNLSDILDDLFGIFSFPRARFSGNQQRLVHLIVQHLAISKVRSRKNMRSNLILSLSTVQISEFLRVDWNHLVRIDRHQKETTVSVNQITEVSFSQVVQHSGVVKLGKMGTILNTIKHRRIHHLEIFCGNVNFFPTSQLNSRFRFTLLDHRTLDVSVFSIWGEILLILSPFALTNRSSFRALWVLQKFDIFGIFDIYIFCFVKIRSHDEEGSSNQKKEV
mmetsp:Transcript_37185/g.51335  ORF Transcript_37185/g.51335 Transcript_37185/m.51335 type:complete len:296 (-) Transcript_37185:30-917(-)